MSKVITNNITPRSGSSVGLTGDLTASGSITGTTGTFTGNVSVGGTLTYEDVTNIDSVGVITARSDVSIADKIIHTGDTNTAIRFPAADTFTVETAGSERLRVDSSGSVGVGENSPSSYDSGARQLVVAESTNNAGITIRSASNKTGSLYFADGTTGNEAYRGRIEYVHSADELRLGTAGTGSKVIINSAGGATFNGTALFKGGLAEKYENAATTLGAQTNNPLSDGNVILFSGNESGNNTINFTGVHSTITTGETVSFTAIISPNNSGVINVVQVDGQAIAVKWSGGSIPTAGTSGQDVYTFQILKTGTGTSDYTVFGAAANYATA